MAQSAGTGLAVKSGVLCGFFDLHDDSASEGMRQARKQCCVENGD